jgi:ketosteroid isomerase-like protein
MDGMKSTLLSILLAAAFAAAAPAGVEDDVRAADMEWAAAAKAADTGKLERLLSTDLVYNHANGVIDDKASYIAKIKSGRQKYAGIEHSNIRIKVFGGDTAVLTARMRMHGTNPNGPFDDQIIMMHVWVKAGGSWHLVGHQTTKLQ